MKRKSLVKIKLIETYVYYYGINFYDLLQVKFLSTRHLWNSHYIILYQLCI